MPALVAPQGIFVSPSGDDTTGSGTIDKPYRHIQYVLDEIAKPDETIILREGVYDEAVRIRKPKLTLRSHQGEWATIRQQPSINAEDAAATVMFDVDSDGGRLQRLEVIGGYYGVFLQTKWDWEDSSDWTGATDILIEDCKVHDTGVDAIKITPGSDRTVIRRTEIYRSGAGYPPGTKFDKKNAEGIDCVNADDVLVQDSYIHDAATTCVYLKGGSKRGIIERTRAERCGRTGIAVGFDTSPEWFDLEDNPEYYENIDGIVRNCLVRDTGYAGIAMYAAKRPRVLNNTIINTASQGHAAIYFGVTFQDWDPHAKRPPTSEAFVANNIIVQSGAGRGVCAGIRYSEELGGLSGLEGSWYMDHNLFFRPGGHCELQDARPKIALEDAPLSQWKKREGVDRNSVEKDPFLGSDGCPQSASPARNIGAPTPWVTFDLKGKKRGATFDVGACKVGDS